MLFTNKRWRIFCVILVVVLIFAGCLPKKGVGRIEKPKNHEALEKADKLGPLLKFLWEDFKKSEQKNGSFQLTDYEMISLWSQGEPFRADSEPDAVGCFIQIREGVNMESIRDKLIKKCDIIVNTTAGEILTAVVPFPEGLKCSVGIREVKKIEASVPVKLDFHVEEPSLNTGE